jgi:hypothetical protein
MARSKLSLAFGPSVKFRFLHKLECKSVTLENPTHENNPEDDAGKKPSEKSQTAPQFTPPAGIPKSDIPPAPDGYQITCKAEKDWRDKMKFWAEIFGILVLLVYTLFTAGIFCANYRAADAAHQTLIEIQKQTVFQKQQTVGTYAAAIPKANPWPQVVPDDLDLLNYTGIGLTYVNVGKVKATNFVAEATLTRQILPSYKPLGIPEHKQIKAELKPNSQTSPEGSGDAAQIRFDTTMLTGHDIALLYDLGQTIEISGSFQYDNGFGDTVREAFCFLYTFRPQHIFSSGAATGGGPKSGAWYTCEDAKFSIAESLKWKKKS